MKNLFLSILIVFSGICFASPYESMEDIEVCENAILISVSYNATIQNYLEPGYFCEASVSVGGSTGSGFGFSHVSQEDACQNAHNAAYLDLAHPGGFD